MTIYADKFEMSPFYISIIAQILGLLVIMQMIKIDACQKFMSDFRSQKTVRNVMAKMVKTIIKKNKLNLEVS